MKCILQTQQLVHLELKPIGVLLGVAVQLLGDKIYRQESNIIIRLTLLVLFSLFVLFESFNNLLVRLNNKLR